MSAPDEATDDTVPAPERRLAAALKEHSGTITANLRGALDDQLDQRVLGEARRISAKISGNRAGTALSARPPIPAPGIPWWLWLAWVAAVVGVAAVAWLALR